MAVQKNKFTFSVDGVKYKDINGYFYKDNINLINLGVAGTAQMIRQWIKQKYPNIPLSNYFWVNSSSYSNINVYLNNAPTNFFDDIKSKLQENFEYGSNHYSYQKSSNIKDKTDEGKEINYGTKYLFLSNNPPSTANAPTVDWGVISQAPKKVLKSSIPKVASGGGKNFDRGELISDCAGWEINKKVYTDGRVLYSANKKPNTPKNKTDWNIIKGEVLTETGFSYSKYGNFQKWGQISSEASIIAKLCEILGKYYTTNTVTISPTTSLSYKVGDKFKESDDRENPPTYLYTITDIDTNSNRLTFDILRKSNNTTTSEVNTITRWDAALKNGVTVPYVEPTSVALPTPKIKVTDPTEQAEDIAEQLMNADYNIWNKLNINSGGELYNSQILQEQYAQLLIEAFDNIIYYYPNITIEQKNLIRDKIEHDNYHSVNNALSLLGFYGEAIASIRVNDYIQNPSYFLNPIYYPFASNLSKQTAVVTSPPTVANGVNESYKLLPPNPKLEFCAINQAEGSYEDGVLPIQFQSFTALTKFIADNIKNMPKKGEGYDKYYISYKWKFKVQETDRYDVSEGEDNPYKYKNLWAFEEMRTLCYYAWAIDAVGFSDYQTDDLYFATVIGKEGWELDSVQFMSLLTDIIEYYPEDKKKFNYNTKDERLDRFKAVYPQLFKLFSEQTPVVTRESIEAIIKGYEIMLKRGDNSAAAIIKGYQIILKRL